MLVANKIDKPHERVVSRREGEELAKAFRCRYVEVSARTTTRVEKVFTDAVKISREADLAALERERKGSLRDKKGLMPHLLDLKGRETSCALM